MNVEDDHNVVDPPTNVVGWTTDNGAVLISDRWDIWKVPVAAGTPAVNLTVNGTQGSDPLSGTRCGSIRRSAASISSKPQYFSAMSEWTKRAGYGVLEPGKTGLKMLLWDDASIAGLQKAEKARRLDLPPRDADGRDRRTT